jgi:hypothetical protein
MQILESVVNDRKPKMLAGFSCSGRHSFGSLLLDAGAPLAYVSEQMGHADTVITAQIYIHSLRKNAGFVNRLDTQPAATKARCNRHSRRDFPGSD